MSLLLIIIQILTQLKIVGYMVGKTNKIAIMQPYFLPYIGYFQLINAVDVFVVYDDVTWIIQGWINRNRILMNGTDFMFTLKVKGISSNKLINSLEIGDNRNKLLKTVLQAYRKAPYYKENEELLFAIFDPKENNLVKYIVHSLKHINQKLNIQTPLILSSDIKKKNTLKGQDKVIEICKKLNAQIYINAIGGMNLYNKETFLTDNIELFFIKTKEVIYPQNNIRFVPNLSIIDVLMYNSLEKTVDFLNQYELI